jgi:hypothetical protein
MWEGVGQGEPNPSPRLRHKLISGRYSLKCEYITSPDFYLPKKQKEAKMVGDIKVLSPEGKLIRIISGQAEMNKKYKEISVSLKKTPWGQEKIGGILVTCVECKITVEGQRSNQITCGSEKCIRLRGNRKKYPNSARVFNCAACGLEMQTRHHNKRTCGTERCFKDYNNIREKARLKKNKAIALSL